MDEATLPPPIVLSEWLPMASSCTSEETFPSSFQRNFSMSSERFSQTGYFRAGRGRMGGV